MLEIFLSGNLIMDSTYINLEDWNDSSWSGVVGAGSDCLPHRRSTLVARSVECWTADSENRSDVGSNLSDASYDIWCQKCLCRLWTDGTALFLLGISEWMPIAGQGGPKSWAKADHDQEPRRTTIEGQGGPSTRCEGEGGPRLGV